MNIHAVRKIVQIKIPLLLALLLLLGCGKQAKTDEVVAEEAIVLGEVKEWLFYEGEKEKPHVVFVSGDEEYRSEEALPQLARILNEHHGFNCTVLFSQNPDESGVIDPNYLHNIPGLEALENADLMVIFTRFRSLPDDQMKMIDDYLLTGKPVFGIRTATHAFNFKEEDKTSFRRYGNYYDGDDAWKGGFGRLVLGEKWINHHGNHGNQSTRGIIAPGSEGHPIVNGIEDGSIWGATDVYGVRLPFPEDSQPIILGQTINRSNEMDENDPRLGMRPTDSELPEPITKEQGGKEVVIDQNDPMMPVAWIKSYQIPDGQSGRVFTTTMGASTDLLEESTRRLMVNAVFWTLDLDVPEKANVDIIGSYSPTRFAFRDDAYWRELHLVIGEID